MPFLRISRVATKLVFEKLVSVQDGAFCVVFLGTIVFQRIQSCQYRFLGSIHVYPISGLQILVYFELLS